MKGKGRGEKTLTRQTQSTVVCGYVGLCVCVCVCQVKEGGRVRAYGAVKGGNTNRTRKKMQQALKVEKKQVRKRACASTLVFNQLLP